MATVNYSVPDEVKRAFNEAFRGRNKSAIVADLMRQAVEEEQCKMRRARAIDELLTRRAETPSVSAEEMQAARDEVRAWP